MLRSTELVNSSTRVYELVNSRNFRASRVHHFVKKGRRCLKVRSIRKSWTRDYHLMITSSRVQWNAAIIPGLHRNILVFMLRSTELVKSWSRDGNHEFTTCEWNAIFFHEVVNSGCKHEFTSSMECSAALALKSDGYAIFVQWPLNVAHKDITESPAAGMKYSRCRVHSFAFSPATDERYHGVLKASISRQQSRVAGAVF